MSFRYVELLLLYSLASFGVLLVLCQAALFLLHRSALRMIENLRSRDGVITHLVLRYLPTAIALILTVLSAVPGYFEGEPVTTQESPSLWLICLAMIGLYSILEPIASILWIALRTSAKTNAWEHSAVAHRSFGGFALFDLDLHVPFIVASGIIRKSIFVSKPVQSLLSERELRAALRHEAAHCQYNHNLAKLLFALAPRAFSIPGFDNGFQEVIEFAADDEACKVPGDALNLASAVVILARQSASNTHGMLCSALVAVKQSASLERRVERLVVRGMRRKSGRLAQLAMGCVAVVAATSAFALLSPAQQVFREALEHLVR
jgi:Zn-dependent protease with chaperone function